MKRKLILCVMISAACALSMLTGCANQTDSQNSPASSAASIATSDSAPDVGSGSKSERSSDDIVALDGQGGVEVYLDYNAGTGYEWECSVEPEGVIGIAYQETRGASEDKDITGEPLRDVVTLIANAPGAATLTCELKRPWETDAEPAEMQTFVFTVDSSLQIDFDEDASNFEEHPASISFS